MQLKLAMQEEYGYYEKIFHNKLEQGSFSETKFYESYESLMNQEKPYIYLSSAILDLTRAVYEFYNIRPILLIDEYDQPLLTGVQRGAKESIFSQFNNPQVHTVKRWKVLIINTMRECPARFYAWELHTIKSGAI